VPFSELAWDHARQQLAVEGKASTKLGLLGYMAGNADATALLADARHVIQRAGALHLPYWGL
jgi:hypothetical protein